MAIGTAAVTLPGLAGMHSVVVRGGSMGAALPSGSVAVTQTVPAGDVRVGDVLARRHIGSSMPILHRVVSIDDSSGERQAITRGDANTSDDPTAMLLAGNGDRVIYYVPLVGYVFTLMRTPAGIGLLVVTLAFPLGRRALSQGRSREAPRATW